MVQAHPQNGSEVARASLPVSHSPDFGSTHSRSAEAAGSSPDSRRSRGVAVSLPLSQRDRDLLSAISSPGTDAEAVLATLPPDEIGPWLERSEIQAAIAAAFELREIRLRFKIAAATDRAVERMAAVLDAGKDLSDAAQRTETRQAAAAIFRLQSRATDRAAAHLFSPSHPAVPRAVRSVQHPAHQDAASSPLTHHSGRGTQDAPEPAIAQRLKDLRARITANSPLGTRQAPLSTHGERPPLDTTTPAAAIAAVLNAFKTLPNSGPRAAYDRVEKALADPVTHNPVLKERFLTHLAASPALTARHGPYTTGPIEVNDRVATQRVIYTLEDGSTAAACFRAVRKDPGRFERYPTISWQIDSITPADDTS